MSLLKNIFTLFLLVPLLCVSQDKEYIVTNTQDTIYGKVTRGTNILNTSEVIYDIKDEDGNKMTVDPSKTYSIRSFKGVDGDSYIRTIYDKWFAKRIVDGRIQVYALINSGVLYVSKDDSEIAYTDIGGFFSSDKAHSQIRPYIEDHPELLKEFDTLKGTAKNILYIIEKYNNAPPPKPQKAHGIWMSYNDRIIDINAPYTSPTEGFLIDFDEKTFGRFDSDLVMNIDIDFTKKQLLTLSDTIKVDFRIFQNDSIEIELLDNIVSVFRPLDLSHGLAATKQQIITFLTSHNFEILSDPINIEFSDAYFFRDVMFDVPFKKFALMNKSRNERGYWFITEIQQNFYLTLTLDETADQNIYQILSMDTCEMKLKRLQDATFGSAPIQTLKTCQ